MSRNGFGPSICGNLFHTLSASNCTITNLNISDNPLGYSSQLMGSALVASKDIRIGLGQTNSLRYLNLNRTMFLPVDLVPIIGGLAHNKSLSRISLQDIYLDEPSCLQLCNGIEHCISLVHLNLENCRMGSSGSALVAIKIRDLADRIEYLNLNNNYMGPIAAIYIGEALLHSECKIETIRLARNDLIAEGGSFIAKSMIGK